jgi:hypothetical protein
MRYICDAPHDRTWFQIETEGEAAIESDLMRHAVEKYFRQEMQKAALSYKPPAGAPYFEHEIGLKAYRRKVMPLFLTLRDGEGTALVTAMLPPEGREDRGFRPIIVGPDNADPYVAHGDAIRALADRFSIALDKARCYPYRRG